MLQAINILMSPSVGGRRGFLAVSKTVFVSLLNLSPPPSCHTFGFSFFLTVKRDNILLPNEWGEESLEKITWMKTKYFHHFRKEADGEGEEKLA